ncbi:hypothetical protein D3C80_1541260 [compost metagenome]
MGFHQPLFDGKRADRTQHVAAVGRGVDASLGDHDLHEQVIDVGVRVQRGADDRHLAGLRAATTDAVDFQLMARPHQADQYFVAFHHIGRQVPGMEERAFGGTAAHEHTRDSLHDY